MNKQYLIDEYEKIFLANSLENQNLIIYILFKVNENIKKGHIRTIIKTKELRYIAKYVKKDIDNKYIKQCLEHLEHTFLNAKVQDNENNVNRLFSFTNIEINDECSQIMLTFNEKMQFILNNLLENLSKENLEVYIKLNTYPKKALYYYLNKNKDIGNVTFTFDDIIRKIFAYEINDANEYNIYTLIEYLNLYFNNLYSKIEYEKTKRGLQIKDITFYFTPQTKN